MKKTILSFLLVISCLLIFGCAQETSTPVITCSTDKMDDVIVQTEVTLPSATAQDALDGDLTSNMIVIITAPSGERVNATDNKFTPSEVGKYTVVFSITNSNGILATKAFEFQSKEQPAPTIALENELGKYYQNDEANVPSVKATDLTDGDLTANVSYQVKDPDGATVLVEEGCFTPSKLGTYVIVYSVSNSEGKTGTLSVQLEVQEVPSPVLTLNPTSLSSIKLGQSVTLPQATASDEIDGALTNITIKVTDPSSQEVSVLSGVFTPAVDGLFTITYEVTNAHGLSDTKTLTVQVKDAEKPVLTSEVESITADLYKGMSLTIPTVVATDEVDGTLTPSVKVTYPDTTEEVLEGTTLSLTQFGTYTLTYTATNNAKKTADLTFTFDVQEAFEIGWDARMYTAAISTMTKTIAEQYRQLIVSKLAGTIYENVEIKMVPFDQSEYLALGTAINASKVQVIVGFTSTTFNPVDAETNPCGVPKVAAKWGMIALAENRCVAQIVDSDMAKMVYDLSTYTEASKDAEIKVFEGLEVKQIVVGWFQHKESTEARINAVELALENYFAEKGYTIDVISKVFAKGTGDTAYSSTHDAMVEAEVVIGFNWGTNFNSTSGFLFTKSRLTKNLTFGTTSGRCVSSMVKQNTIYVFYNELFDFMSSATMTAIYQE